MLDRTAKPALNFDHLFHTIYCRIPTRNGVAAGWYAIERVAEDMGRAATVRDIAIGQVEDVAAVIAWNAIEHTCDDVTADIAIEIANSLDVGEPISPELRDFLQDHLGVESTRGLRVHDRSFAA